MSFITLSPLLGFTARIRLLVTRLYHLFCLWRFRMFLCILLFIVKLARLVGDLGCMALAGQIYGLCQDPWRKDEPWAWHKKALMFHLNLTFLQVFWPVTCWWCQWHLLLSCRSWEKYTHSSWSFRTLRTRNCPWRASPGSRFGRWCSPVPRGQMRQDSNFIPGAKERCSSRFQQRWNVVSWGVSPFPRFLRSSSPLRTFYWGRFHQPFFSTL